MEVAQPTSLPPSVLVVEPSGVGTITIDLEEGLLGSECARVCTSDEAERVLASSQDIDLVVIDLQFAGINRLEIIQRLHKTSPELPIVVLSDRQDPDLEPAVLEAGAEDLLWKGRRVEIELAKTVRRARSTRRRAQRLGAVSDELTGLANRGRILTRLAAVLERDMQAAMLFVDLDGFKAINDLFGHDTGDRVLVAAAKMLESYVRRTETVARWGGDEFVVLLEGKGAHIGAERVAKQILEGVTSLATEMNVRLGASVGMAISLAGETGEDLVQRADEAMYRAKRRGGQRVVRADGDRTDESLRFRMRDAHAGTAVCEVFTSGQESTQDIEALIGRSGIGDEDCGLIDALIALADGTVAADAVLALRLSGVPQNPDDVAETMEQLIINRQIDVSRFEVVVDASLTAMEPERSAVLFEHLKSLGIATVLRAFGGAAAVLEVATAYNWSAVELDVGVVRDLAAGGPRAVVVQGLVQIARALNLEVRAIGVTSARDAVALRGVGISQILGQPRTGARPAHELRVRYAQAS